MCGDAAKFVLLDGIARKPFLQQLNSLHRNCYSFGCNCGEVTSAADLLGIIRLLGRFVIHMKSADKDDNKRPVEA